MCGSPRVVDDLTAHESAALLAMLNAHFAGDGLRFIALAPGALAGRRRPTAQQLVTRPGR